MVWVSLFAGFVLFISFFTGLKEGAVRQGFNLVIALIAIPLAGTFYSELAGSLLSFLPGVNWPNFLAFFIILGIVSAIMHTVVFMPRRMIQKVWKRGLIYRLFGAGLSLLNACIGLTVLALAINAYPVLDLLARWFADSSVIQSLVSSFDFIQSILPEIFHIGPISAMLLQIIA